LTTLSLGRQALPGSLPRHHVHRPRLVERLASSRAALVTAGGGYGKSLLAAELAHGLGLATVKVVLGDQDATPQALVARIAQGLARAQLRDAAVALRDRRLSPGEAVDALATALAAEREPVVLVIDDAHHLGTEAQGLVRHLVAAGPDDSRFLVLSRSPLALLANEAPVHDVLQLGGADLAFRPSETVELASRLGCELGTTDALALCQATGGWVAALVLALRQLSQAIDMATDLRRVIEQKRPLRYLLDRQLEAMGPQLSQLVVQLAHLPLISATVVEAVAGTSAALERAGAIGLPVSVRLDGWCELPGPVQELLRRMGPLEASTARAAALVYARSGELAEAVAVLLGAGLADDAAEAAGSVTPQDADELGFLRLQTIADAIPASALDRHPHLLLHLARACEPAAQTSLRSQCLERVAGLATSTADGPLSRAAVAELCRDMVRDGQPRQAESLALSVLEQAGPEEVATRVRVLDALGRAAAWGREEAQFDKAARLLREAHSLCLQLGHRSWASQVVLPLAHGVYYAAGRFDEALAWIEAALADLPARSPHRGVTLSFYGDILVDCGRFAEAYAAADEARQIGRFLGDARVSAYAEWTTAKCASCAGDPAKAAAAVGAAEAFRHDWFEHSTGVTFLADAANLLNRAGQHELSASYLARAQARRDEAPLDVAVADAAIAARSGDPQQARRLLAELSVMPRLEPRERWWVTLMMAYAATRAKDQGAARLVSLAFEQAEALGNPNLPLYRERAVVERLAALASGDGAARARALLSTGPKFKVVVLGRFGVASGGDELVLPPGKPEQLVKVLAVAGRRLPTEVVIEHLWPEVEPQSGRKRLRNTLNRLRSVAPDLVQRSGEALALNSSAEVDMEGFEREATRALEQHCAGLPRLVAHRYPGPVLPDDIYEDWAAPARERISRLFLSLLDAAAEEAQANGDFDEAVRYAERAIELGPYDELRYVRAARILLGQGRRAATLSVLQRARKALASLGVAPSGALVQLEQDARA